MGILTLLVLIAQLFTFEKFADVLRAYHLPGGETVVGALIVFIPLLELLSLPFWVSMRMSRALRITGHCVAIATPIIWLALVGYRVVTVSEPTNSGILGATVPIATSLYLLIAIVACGAIAYYVSKRLPARKPHSLEE